MEHPRQTELTADEFIAWALEQPTGRFELDNGVVFAMAPERVGHSLAKAHAWLALRTLLALSPDTLPALSAAGVDWRVLSFTLLVSVVTGLLFGVVPALQATRGDVSEGLRDGSRGSVGSRRAHRTRSILVVAEVGLAVVLLVGALLLARTFLRLLAVDTGFRTENVLTMEVALPRQAYSGAPAAAA